MAPLPNALLEGTWVDEHPKRRKAPVVNRNTAQMLSDTAMKQ